MSYIFPLPGLIPSIVMGLADINENSSDKPRFVAGESGATATVQVPGGRQIEVAGRMGGVIRLQVGTPRRYVIRRLGNTLVTSILQKAGIISFDSEGRLIREPAPETGNGGEGWQENESGNGKTRR